MLSFASLENTWGNLFPWLKDSYCGNYIARLSDKQNPVRNFPKISASQENGCITERDLRGLEALLRSEKIPKMVTLHPAGWKSIVHLLTPGVIYQPLPLSTSPDLMYLTPEGVLLCFQLKNGTQTLSYSTIATELAKCPQDIIGVAPAPLTPDERPHPPVNQIILIIMGFRPCQNVEHDINKGNGVAIYKEGHAFEGSIKVQRNVQVVVPSSSNVDQFLLPANASVLKQDSANQTSYYGLELD